MGREIRRVPPNWSHPKNDRGQLQPMFNRLFVDVFSDWLGNFDRIRRGELTSIERECYAEPGMNPLAEWLRDEGVPPNPAYYRPWRNEDATWVQVWETVSEGTPVTPPFATPEELVDYLATKGDFWDQSRGDAPWSRHSAEAFVKAGWGPSMIRVGNEIATSKDAATLLGRP